MGENEGRLLEEQVIAKIIRDETKGGYLQDWSDCAVLMTEEQKTGYFLILARMILIALKAQTPEGK